MIKAERRAGNPVAGLIDSLALDKNKITVVLENFLDEEAADDEAMTRPATKVGSWQGRKLARKLRRSFQVNDACITHIGVRF